MKPVGELYAGNRLVWFDERGWETGRCRMAQVTAPILDSTVFVPNRRSLGSALLLASLIAGVLWEVVGPSATFVAGATFTVIGLLGSGMFIGR